MQTTLEVQNSQKILAEKKVRCYIATPGAEGPPLNNLAKVDYPVVIDAENASLVPSPDQRQIIQQITRLNLADLTNSCLETLEAFFVKIRCYCQNPLRIKE